MVRVSAWGRLSHDEHQVVALHHGEDAAVALSGQPCGVAFGNGRSYGDACLNPGGRLWDTRGLDRFIEFDPATGRLRCEGGMLLREVQQMSVPRGWMLPVTPGTQLATVGGAIANDVHGKNHHAMGTFAHHVNRITLLRTDGEMIDCGPGLREDWFRATVGGIGMTGVILSAELQLRRVDGPWLATETIPYTSLDAFFQLADASEADWEYTVSWIDCLSAARGVRGLFMRANHADPGKGPQPRAKSSRFPVTPPIPLVNGATLRAFNTAYYRIGAWRAGRKTAHYQPFFYPLDNLLDWNRIYGPAGFHQYQCVVPRDTGAEAITALLREIARSGTGSFLAILKTFGDRASAGMLSFPMAGVTLALDFPNHGPSTLALLYRLDAIVAEAKGRLYLAKDSRMPRSLFESGYPVLPSFLPFRDPGISSAMSCRLMGY